MASTTCLCGKAVEGPVISGPLVTPHVLCGACGRECVIGRVAEGEIHKGNASFHGQKSWSLASGCHPTEAPLYRKIMGAAFETCIKDDGSVKFKNQKQQAAFVKRFEEARLMNQMDPGCYDRGDYRPDDLTRKAG